MSSEFSMPLDRDTVIQCKDLGKCYQIYNNPKDRLKQAIWRGKRQYFREFWALRDVNFEVRRGESLGIIGRNGSGKSTLLQLICGTLTPTEGTIRTKGRIAALLELGSGFNPEFTGLENIYLNASMLGLSKDKTDKQLDDILSFADIGDFLDQPVKTYSSGMAVRLAFAVIAHVDADILVVDEALAVGDAFFTQKCMRFINRFKSEHSLLFVSHDAAAVTTLCDKALFLSQGSQIILDKPKKALDCYMKDFYSAAQTVNAHSKSGESHTTIEIDESCTANPKDWIDYRKDIINSSGTPNLLEISQFSECLLSAESFGNGKATISSAELIDFATKKSLLIGKGGERTILRITALALETISRPIIGFLLKNDKGLTLLGDNTLNSRTQLLGDVEILVKKNEYYCAEFEFTLPLLPKGKYSFTLSLAEGTQLDHSQLQWMNDALIFESINCCVAAGLAGIPMHRIAIQSPITI